MLPTNTHILFPEFEYHTPATVYEATELLAHWGEDARLIAGGTDLLVQMKMERRQPAHVVSLQHINALQTITQNGALIIGASSSIYSVYHHLLGQNQAPTSETPFTALAEACNSFSTVQIMYMATIGGNLCNASPAADSAPCLLCFDAVLTLKSKTQERVVSLKDFFVGPGRTIAQPEELLTHIQVPLPPAESGSAFLKISRVAADISQVCAAVNLVREGSLIRDVRIALGSVAPIPLLVSRSSASLVGQPFTPELAEHAGEIAAQEISPIDDVRATREYRQTVAAVLVRDALLKAWERSF